MIQEHRQEQITRYLAGYTSSHGVDSLTTWITHGVGYFDALGVTWPNDTNYQGLRAEILATLPGRGGCGRISSGQAAKRVAETRKFYEWLKQQEGETKQMSLFEETAQQAEIEPVSSEGVAVQEVSAPAENEGVSEAEGADAGASADVEGESTGRENSGSLSVDTVQPVDESPAHDTPAQPKRGRRPKAENADRVQVSVYLSRDVYEGLRALAQAKGLNLSDMVARAANSFFERNTQSIATAQQALRNLDALSVEY